MFLFFVATLQFLMKSFFLLQHKKLLDSKRKESDELQTNAGGIIERGKNDREELEAAQKRLQALAVGLSANDEGDDATLANQLMSN